MNAEITDKVANELLKWVQSTGEFVSEQAPDIANQIVQWGIWSSAAGVVFGLFLIIIAGVGFCLVGKGIGIFDEDPFDFITGACSLGAAVAGLIVTVCNTYNLVLAAVAPKLYIMEYLSHLVR